MDPQEIVDMCVKRGADDVVCTVQSAKKKQIRFAKNEITASKLWDSTSASIFMVRDKRIVVTSLDDFSQVESTLDNLFSLSRVLEPTEDYNGIAEGSFTYRVTPEAKMDIDTADVIEGVFSEADDCNAAGVIYTIEAYDEIATSSGIRSNDEGASVELSVRMFADAKSSGHAVSCARSPREFDPQGACARAKDIALASRGASQGKEGKYDVVFSPLCFSNFLDHMMFQTSAFYVDSGLSFFKDRLGTQIASPNVTLYDDGIRADGLNSSRYDDEGVPTQRTEVIGEGVLKTYLHNTSTAKKYGTSTTANAGLMAPSPTNIVLQEGGYDFDEMIRSVDHGLYITNTWYTRYQNYSTGDFSSIPRDGIFLIEKGEISDPVREIRISDNMLTMLSNVAAVGNDTRQIHWWETEVPTFTPHVLVKDVTITKSTG